MGSWIAIFAALGAAGTWLARAYGSEGASERAGRLWTLLRASGYRHPGVETQVTTTTEG